MTSPSVLLAEPEMPSVEVDDPNDPIKAIFRRLIISGIVALLIPFLIWGYRRCRRSKGCERLFMTTEKEERTEKYKVAEPATVIND